MSDTWGALAAPFAPGEVKERQGPKQHDGACQKSYGQCSLRHKMLSYVDARDVEQRLDDVLTPAGWDFQVSIAQAPVVHGRLILYLAERAIVREDYGYPNSDDDAEPLKSAASDALKRCAVQIGVGRHLYADNKPKAQAATADATPTPVAAPRASQAPTRDATQGIGMRDFFSACEAAGIDRKRISERGKYLFGKWSVKDMDNGERAELLADLTTDGSGTSSPEPAAAPPSPTAATPSGPTAATGPEELSWEGLAK